MDGPDKKRRGLRINSWETETPSRNELSVFIPPGPLAKQGGGGRCLRDCRREGSDRWKEILSKGFLPRMTRRGMTLVEVLVGMVIVSALLASLLSFYAKGQQQFFQGNVRSDVLDKVRYPLSWISRDVTVAQLVDWKHEDIWASGAVLILELPCLDVNGDAINDINQSDAVVYSLTNNRLTRHCHTHPASYRQAGDRVLADHVAGLAVTYYDDNENVLTSSYTQAAAVKVEVTVSVDIGSRNFRQALSSRFTLRNKAT